MYFFVVLDTTTYSSWTNYFLLLWLKDGSLFSARALVRLCHFCLSFRIGRDEKNARIGARYRSVGLLVLPVLLMELNATSNVSGPLSRNNVIVTLQCYHEPVLNYTMRLLYSYLF
jgi:hypothetical protein